MPETAIREAVEGRNGEIRIKCPFSDCTGGQAETMGVDTESGKYHCFRCNRKGNVYKSGNSGNKPEYIWDNSNPCTEHPYLSKKKVKSHGLKIDKYGNLVVPVYRNNQLLTLQLIKPTGEKNLLGGCEKQGGCFQVGTGTGDIVYFCEGYATAASIFEAVGGLVFMAIDAGNLKPVAENLRRTYPNKSFVFCADNDKHGKGYQKAAEAAQAVDGVICIPEQVGYDFNDLAIEYGLDAVEDCISKAAAPKVNDIWDNPATLISFIDTEPKPLNWFIQDRVLMGRGMVLTGIGGSSKTRMLYHLGAGVALGRLPWEWKIAAQGRSVLVLTEDVFEDLHRTIHNLCLSIDASLEEKQLIYKSIIPYPLAGQDIKLLQKTKSGTLEKSNLFHSLANKIKSLGDIVFIGLDPALSLTDGDELDQGHQRALGKMADDLAVKTGAVCALVTHATKGSIFKDELTSHNSRGGGAITDAVRAEYVMRTMTGKEAVKAKLESQEERFRHVQLVGTKGNYLPPSAYIPIWLRRDDYGMLNQADISMQEGNEPSKKEMEAYEVLREISGGCEVSLKDWRDKLIELSLIGEGTKENQKKIMDRIRKRLNNCGYIQKGNGRGFWVPTDEDNFLDFN